RQVGLIPAEADLAALVLNGGPVVYDALRVVRVAGALTARRGIGEAARELGMQRIVHVHHMEPTAAHLTAEVRTREIDVAADGIGGDIVYAVRQPVMRILCPRLGSPEAAQPVEVKDLHAVIAHAVRHDEGVMLVRLDLAPEGAWRAGGLRQIAEVD